MIAFHPKIAKQIERTLALLLYSHCYRLTFRTSVKDIEHPKFQNENSEWQVLTSSKKLNAQTNSYT